MDNIIDLKALAAEIGDNIPSEYLPVKTNYNECDWDVVAGYFVSFALNKELKKYTKNDFEQDCKAELLAKQMNENFGIKATAFKKLAKVAYLESIEEEKAKSEEFYNLFTEIMG